jgi:hypothetical protein
MLEQIDMRDGRDGYVHYCYWFVRDGSRSMLTVKVEQAADRTLLNEVAHEKLRQQGISTWSYVLRFLNEQFAAGWSPKDDASIVLAVSDARHLTGKKQQH